MLTVGYKYTIFKWTLSTIIEKFSKAQIFIIIGDSIIQKYGTHFEDVSIIFDHRARNYSYSLNSHCFAGILLSVAVLINHQLRYIKEPVEYKFSVPAKERSEDDKNKLQMALI